MLALTKASVAVGLSALLCVPAYASAESGMAVPSQAVQQGTTVKGNVVDETGMPMIGVTVKVKGGKATSVTDFDGNFQLSARQGDNLEISYVGYKTVTVRVGAAPISVKMEPDVTGLEDVVVIGYGTMKRRDLTGSVASVKSEDITLSPTPNPVEALQGKVAGLDITRSSGQAGASVSMKLRGTRSLSAADDNNDAPMVLVDGLPGSLSTLNANDIESIEVLKDAASTAVYGSAGANGIIIVTTKSGKAGKTKVNLNAYVGINGWSTTPEMYHGEAFFNIARTAQMESGAYTDDEHVFNEEVYNAYINGEDINWADALLKTGITQNYSLSISGGTDKTTAYMSLNYTGEDGQYKNDNYKVYSSNIKIDHKIRNWLSIGANMQGSFAYKNTAYAKLENALITRPIGSLYDEDGNVNVFPVVGDDSTVSLLLNNRSNYRNNSQNTNIYLNPYIRINPLKGLTFESRLSLALSFSKVNKFEGIGSYQYYNANRTADGISTNANVKANVATNNAYNYKWENILTYNFKIGEDHDFTLTGVTSWNHNRREYTYAGSDNITSNSYLWHYLEGGQNQTVSSWYKMSKGMGLVGRITYSYKGKYLASASVRHDGSSRLAEGNKWDTFPAFSLGWRISEEKFMQGTRSWLDNLKIRGGWGVTGTASIAEYQTQSNLIQSYMILGNQTLLSYAYPQQIVDPNLGWEKSYNTNIGLDASFLNGRIDFTLDYYYTKTKDIIWTSLVPITNGGYTSSEQYKTTTNICESQNNGIELALTARPFIAKKDGDFSWTINGTFTKNSEKLTKFSADDGTSQYINGDIILKEGEPINSYYDYKLNGTWKLSEADEAAIFNAEPGDLKIDCPGLVRHKNEDGSIYYTGVNANGEEVVYDATNPYDATQAKQVLGHQQPDWTMGLKNTFTYKGFDLSVYLYWRYGQMIKYSMLGRYNPQGTSNFPTYFDYWTTETGDQNHYFPALNSSKPLSEYSGWSGLNYVDGSFFKIKNITLGYTLPKNVLKKLGLENLRLYATITNPFVFAKSDLLKDYDPEMAGSLDYPLTKQMVFGVNISF